MTVRPETSSVRMAELVSTLQRVKRLAAFSVTGQKEMLAFLTTHSTLGAQFAEAPVAVARRNRATQYDPALVDLFSWQAPGEYLVVLGRKL